MRCECRACHKREYTGTCSLSRQRVLRPRLVVLIDGKPFAIFIDVKSGTQYPSRGSDTEVAAEMRKDANTKQGCFELADLPKNGCRAEHMRTIANAAKKWDPAKVAKGSMLEALREDDYLYVYVSTRQSAPSFTVGHQVMQLGEADSKHFLSFLLDAYRLVRTASNAAQQPETKRSE